MNVDHKDNHIPACIGIIMDGNRRWAKAQGLPTLSGHQKGYEKVKEVVEWMREAGVKNLILYSFSTENWNRKEEEVSYLMDLLEHQLPKDAKEIAKDDARVRIIGDTARFSKPIQAVFRDLEESTKDNGPYCLGLALSYGGRAEILSAYKKLAEQGVTDPDERDVAGALWTSGMPDPDMIVRTSGEQRLSGFLTWQSVYSELFFTDTLWPDFSKEEFSAMLDAYGQRERRRGK